MEDMIIKGTGNSRWLKSVANIMTLYPTYESFAEALAAGTFPIDLNGINPAGWNIMGDKLDKATLLTDALCTALGLATTATPTQAMEKLRQLVNTAQSTANGRPRVAFGSYSGDDASSRNIYLPGTPIAVIFGTMAGMFAVTNNSFSQTYYGGILSPGNDLKKYGGNIVASLSGSTMTVYHDTYDRKTNSSTWSYYYICIY